MPRSHLNAKRWRALAALAAFSVLASLMLAEAWAEGLRTRQGMRELQATARSAIITQQARRKTIASVRNFDTTDGSRITITSDVPLNDYEAYWSGDRFYVVIPNADINYQNSQTLQSSLHGQGFQDVRIEKRGIDLVFSFRLFPGMRARPEQKFNRLDILFTAPPGASISANRNIPNRNTGIPNMNTGATNSRTGIGNQQANTYTFNRTGTGNAASVGTTLGGTSTGRTSSSGTSTGASSSAGGGGGGGVRSGGRSRSSRGYGYSSGGGGDRGGGMPLNIPLPSDEQANAATSASPSAESSAATNTNTSTANTNTSTGAAANANEGTAQTGASPLSSPQSSPDQIAQNQPQQPVTAPPSTSTTTTSAPAPATSETGFAAAVRDNWLPLLIGLLVLVAIGLLLVSRSRAGREEEPARVETRRRETIKERPASTTDARLTRGAAGGAAAGAALAAAAAKESRAKTVETPVEEEAKAIEPVAPAVGMERISDEVKSLLEGKDYDAAVIGSNNPETRQLVSTELMAALASRNPERRDRARAAFDRHGFFDEATRNLRTASAPAERIAAARSLGLTQDHTATPHLVAALEDDDAEVRRAAVNALAEVRDPSAIGPLNALLEREKNRKVPHSLIRRAIEASATIDVQETPTAATAAPASATPAASAEATAEKKDKDDEDREVFEI